ncbi:hypothetical protein [Planococcus koreensis]|uniref:hypothetical protein n=1 Tax=Planococcus koreensis TaxID=112331 RepID=UPI0039FC6FA3
MMKFSWSKLMFLTMLIFVLALAACGNEDTSNEESTDDSDAATEESAETEEGVEEGTEEVADGSAESAPKVTEFEPAFPEQTRAPAVVTETELDMETVVEGLGVSWGWKSLNQTAYLLRKEIQQNF